MAQTDTTLTQRDTIIHVAESEILIMEDTIIAPDEDTVFFIDHRKKYKIKNNPYKTSREFYLKMQALSKDNKLTARLFDLLFVTENFGGEPIDADQPKSTSNTPFIPYKGLTIHEITIKHVDIISGSVKDTSRVASSGIVKFANKIHTDTWKSVIRDNLLVKKGQAIDPYRVADSERLLRRLRYVEDARIYVFPNHLSGTAELIVVVQDRFAWGIDGGYSSLRDFDLELFNKNIAGWGKYASATWIYEKDHEKPHGYDLRVGAQNINNMITEWEVNHTNDGDRKSWGLRIDKNFVTPEIKYGGGLDIRTIKDSTITFDGEEVHNGFYDLTYQDLWLGRSFVLKADGERKNLIITSRFINRKFNNQPEVSPDSNSIYYDRKMLLGEVTIASQQYIRSKYILSFGITEDVPVGYRYSLVYGRDFNQFYNQNYYGFQLFWSFYLDKFGFLLFDQQVGSFEHRDEIQGVITSEANYYSPLVAIDRYRIRNFISLSYTSGFHQPVHKEISLEDRIDIHGENIRGNSIFTGSAESVIFTPWYFYGFRFAPFIFFNYGIVWDYREENRSAYGYSNIGAGFRIRNESLVINTFEFRVSRYLSPPKGLSPMNFRFSFAIPRVFSRFFRYKPRLLPFR